MVRHSGLQKQVLALYRKILRVAVEKDRTAVATTTFSVNAKQLLTTARHDKSSSTFYACQEFRRQANRVKRNDFKTIEYMIRKGEKQLKLLNMPGVQTVGGPSSAGKED